MTATMDKIDYTQPVYESVAKVETVQPTTVVDDPAQFRMAALPFSTPRSQLYYWSPRWQAEEAAALEELARGEGREFDNIADALRWLCDPDAD